METKTIIVAGDICIDWIFYTYSKENPREKTEVITNWENAVNSKIFKLPGGVLLLRDFVRSACGAEPRSHNIQDLKNYPTSKMISSLSEISEFPTEGSEGPCIRVKKFLGYTGPEKPETTDPFPILEEKGKAELLILDDSGNGFRKTPGAWENIFRQIDENTKIIYKMSWPLFVGDLFDHLTKNYAEQLILIINADDLREEGLNISRRLSWEKTILDFLIKIPGYKDFRTLSACPDIIIRFGLEGVIHYFSSGQTNKKNNKQAVLYYFPDRCEGEFKDKTPGMMQGLTTAFVAWISKHLTNPENKMPVSTQLGLAIPDAMDGAKELLSAGFLLENNELHYPLSAIFRKKTSSRVKTINLPLEDHKDINRDDWSILYEETQMKSDLELAMNYVVHGPSAELQNVPIVHFKNLVLIDRNEVEKFRTVSNIMKEYFSNGQSTQPLSIAVFGPPGSGKSFGVKQLAKDILGKQVSFVEFNLSQFLSINELVRAFHKIRDYTLKGVVPLIFFDEFDSEFNSQSLAWLKYFLAPMQDGEFRDGDAIHPIGKAIFIFAGGTSSSFEEFSRENETKQEYINHFKTAKGPDFLSRLKGYVNITGINKIDPNDRLYVIRRAIILRALLKNQKTIVDKKGKIYIDEDLLRALILVPKYKHGSRSIGSIIDMSMLGKNTKFKKSALPPRQQLELHVHGTIFSKLLNSDLFFAASGEDLAREIHSLYLINQKKSGSSKPKEHPSLHDWDQLPEDLKDSNRHQAYDLLVKLLQVQCFYRTKSTDIIDPEPFEFNDIEIELLAEMEHKRWNSERISSGWTYGFPRDDSNKIHDCLVKWRQLSKEIKNLDRNAVKAIPGIFRNAGYEIYRIEN